jgi:hypothetical protein
MPKKIKTGETTITTTKIFSLRRWKMKKQYIKQVTKPAPICQHSNTLLGTKKRTDKKTGQESK